MARLSEDVPDRFPTSADSQNAIVTVSTGWTGGHGEAVLDERQRVRYFGKLPVYLAAESHSAVFDRADLSGSWTGPVVVRIAGRVRLEERSRVNTSIPGETTPDSFIALVAESIDAIEVVGERAAE